MNFKKEIKYSKKELKKVFKKVMECDHDHEIWKDVVYPLAETIRVLRKVEMHEDEYKKEEHKKPETYLEHFKDENDSAEEYTLMYFKTKDEDFAMMAKDELRHAAKFYGLANAEASTEEDKRAIETELGRHTKIKNMLNGGV